MVNYSARGFGRSCGTPDSRTSPGCDAGWIHLTDHRYESRDTQHLLGLLVDQGVARANALGVTGVSYGGIQSLNLARLRNRIRLPDGSFRPWRSPNGTPLKIAAAYARWPGSDLTNALQPNGRFLDFRTPKPNESITPGGVMKKSYNDGLYFSGNASGFYAPTGGAFSSDITAWKALADRGEPARADALAVGRELTGFHSWAGLTGPSAALLVQNGWTDDLFPADRGAARVPHLPRGAAARGSRFSSATSAIRAARTTRARTAPWSARRPTSSPRTSRVRARRPPTAASSPTRRRARWSRRAAGTSESANWERLHPKTATMRHRRPLRMNSRRRQPGHRPGDRPDRRRRQGVQDGPGRTRQGNGRDPAPLHEALHDARAADRPGADRDQGPWRLHRRAPLGRAPRRAGAGVARRLQAQGQPAAASLLFQLFGNGWRFARGHTAKLELLGNDPNFLRTSNFKFRVRFSRTRVDLPGR